MGENQADRVEGVDFSNVNPILDQISFPITADELIERYGDRELQRTNADPISLRELFDYMGDDSFESEDQLRQMIIGQMPRDSAGRTNYSDRGGAHPTATDDAEDTGDQQSGDVEEGKSTDPDTKQQQRD